MKLNYTQHKKLYIAVFIVFIMLVLSVFFFIKGISVQDAESNAPGSIAGILYDNRTGIPVCNETGVVLESMDQKMDDEVQWPRKNGTFNFTDLAPGEYLLWMGKSWISISLSGDNKVIDGGYDYPEPMKIILPAGKHLKLEFYLDFYASQTWEGNEVDNIRFKGKRDDEVFRYTDAFIWYNPELLREKTLNITVQWDNTELTRADFTIEVLDHFRSETQDFSPGSKTKTLSIYLNDEFYEVYYGTENFFFQIYVDSLPSPDWKPTVFNIYATIA